MSKLRRFTCRDPRKDTLKLLREEVDQLLREREEMVASSREADQRYVRLYDQHIGLRRVILGALSLDAANPPTPPHGCSRSGMPFIDDDECPF